MIRKFLYKNFKCFKEAELSVDYLTTLIGTNASGKTNAIEGMMILSEIVTGRDLATVLDGTKNTTGGVRGGARGCSRFYGDNFTLGCVVKCDDDTDLKYEVTIRVKDKIVVESESLVQRLYSSEKGRNGSWEKLTEKTVFVTKKSSRDSGDIAVTVNNGVKGRNPDINCIKYYACISQIAGKLPTDTKYGRKTVDYCSHIIQELRSILFLSPEPSLMRSYATIGDSSLKVNASNLSSVLYSLCGVPEQKTTLLNIMRELPENEIADISFGKGPLNDVIFFLHEQRRGSSVDGPMSAMQLSDGTLRCLAIASAILSEKEQGTIVIEEIDNGIHPGRAKKLIHVLSKLAKERHLDLIFSTHNPVLLNALTKQELGGVNLVYRSDDTGDGCIIPLMRIRNLQVLLTNGKLGDVFLDDRILSFIKKDPVKQDLTWLEGAE